MRFTGTYSSSSSSTISFTLRDALFCNRRCVLKVQRLHACQSLLLLKLGVLEDCTMAALRNVSRGLICGRAGSLDVRLDMLLMANDIMSFKETSVCEKSNEVNRMFRKRAHLVVKSLHPAKDDVSYLHARTIPSLSHAVSTREVHRSLFNTTCS